MGRPKKRKDGRYVKSFTYATASGEKKRRTIYARTIRELEEKYNTALEEEKQRQVMMSEPGSVTTVEEWVDIWLEIYKTNVAFNTFRMYKLTAYNYIVPAIGHLRLKEVELVHIQSLLNDYTARGQVRTAQIIYITLGQIFEVARKSKYITINPSLDAESPKYKKPNKRALTNEEVALIIHSQMPLKEKAFLMLLLFTGLRRGEALAITRNDIDMRDNLINVRKNLYFEYNQPVIGTPKTESGIRVIPILNELKPMLAEYLLSLEGEVLFPSAQGSFMSESAFKRFWEKVSRSLKTVGVTATDITPHIFRHTFTSNLVKTGVAIKDAQYVLGHKSANVTLNWYAHFDPQAVENVRNLLNGRIIKLVT